MGNEKIKKLDYGCNIFCEINEIVNKVNEIVNKVNEIVNKVNIIKQEVTFVKYKLNNITTPCE